MQNNVCWYNKLGQCRSSWAHIASWIFNAEYTDKYASSSLTPPLPFVLFKINHSQHPDSRFTAALNLENCRVQFLSEIWLFKWYSSASEERMTSTCGHQRESNEKEELEKDTVMDMWRDNRLGETVPEGLTHLCGCGRNLVGWSEGTQPQECASVWYDILPVACGRNEVYAAVHPGVWDPLLPVDIDFLLQVGFILVIDELHNRLPAERKKQFRNEKVRFYAISDTSAMVQ